jgi:hypothetical protein
MSEENKQNIDRLEEAVGRLESKKNKIYFLTYDTKNNARAAIKYNQASYRNLWPERFTLILVVSRYPN